MIYGPPFLFLIQALQMLKAEYLCYQSLCIYMISFKPHNKPSCVAKSY